MKDSKKNLKKKMVKHLDADTKEFEHQIKEDKKLKKELKGKK